MEGLEGLTIGIFTETYKPQVNGVVVSIENLKQILTQKGCRLVIFTVGEESGVQTEDSCIIHRFKSATLPLYPEYRFTLPQFHKIKNLVKSYGLEVLHSHGPFSMGLNALYAHRTLGIPLVGTFHTLLPEYLHYLVGKRLERYADRFLKGYSWKFLKWYYSRCDVVTCPSMGMINLFKEKDFKNVLFISNGIDTTRFTPNIPGSKFREAYGLNDDEKIILYLGRIGVEKNLQPIIQAASLIVKEDEKVKFVIAGRGPAKKDLVSLVKLMGLSEYFVFTGFVPNEILANAYTAADIFVTLSYTENQPLTVLEALSAGKPLIVARASFLTEFVKDGLNGFAVNGAEEFAERVVQILRNDNLELKMGEESRRIAEEHSLEKIGDQIIQLYGSLITD